MAGKLSNQRQPTKEEKEALKELRGAEWEMTRKLAKEDLWFLINEILWKHDPQGDCKTGCRCADYHYQEDLHRPICEEVTYKCTGGDRVLILIPRRHRKTYIVTIAKTIQLILNNPDIRIVILCAIDAIAQERLSLIKRIFQFNKKIKEFFPEFHVPPGKQFGTQSEFTHPMRTNFNLLEPTVRATYLGAPVAGKRLDVLFADDPVEKANVTTPEQADKAVAYFNDLIPLVDESEEYGQIFVLGTRWSYMDLYAALLGENRGDEVRVGVESGSGGRYRSIVRHCLENEKGEPDVNGKPIFSKRFTRQKLMEVLEEYKSDPKRGEMDWWLQWMNICTSPSGKKFHEEWFDSWVPALPSNIVWSGIAVDSATKDEQILFKGDYTAVLVGHFDAYGHLYLTDARHSDSYKSPELMRDLVVMSQKSGVHNIVKEKVGEAMFFGMCQEAFRNMSMPCHTYPLSVRGQGKKLVRIVEALQAPFMSRKIHFVGNPSDKTGFPYQIWRALRDEHVHVGQWAHDDLADALSLFYHQELRVQPTHTQRSEWSIPWSARIPQAGARAINPASLARWKTKIPITPVSESTMSDRSLRGMDAFMEGYYKRMEGDTGKVGDIEIK